MSSIYYLDEREPDVVTGRALLSDVSADAFAKGEEELVVVASIYGKGLKMDSRARIGLGPNLPRLVSN
jgi:hypothetical protein